MIKFIKQLLGWKSEGEQLQNVSETDDSSDINDLPTDEITEKQGDVLSDSKSEPRTELDNKVPIKINYSDLPPYEPSSDLAEYRFPDNSLFVENRKEIVQEFKENKPGIEVPVLWSISNNQIILKDLVELKNIFVTGTQEKGKTTFLHQLIISLILNQHPSKLKLVLVDVKGIEFNAYAPIEYHFLAKLSGSEQSIIKDPSKLINSLNALCIEMDNRYDLLKEAGVRNIKEYNDKFINRKLNPQKGYQYLAFIILIIDDLAGYTLHSRDEFNMPIQRLINEGYKTGIFNIISSSQFVPPLLSVNLLSMISQRVIFQLNNKDDFKRLFDTAKLNKYLEQGEFLYNDGRAIMTGKTVLFDSIEINLVVDVISRQKGYSGAFLLPEHINEQDLAAKEFDLTDGDPLFEDAARLIVQNQVGSTSLLQRRMKLGYNRAGRLMDQLEAAGIVGTNQGWKARDVLIKTESELYFHLKSIGWK